MGYSCSVKAYDTLAKTINKVNGNGEVTYPVTNTWEIDGNKFFYERGRENADGSITGTVFKFTDENHAIKYGSLKIMPDGTVKSWPGMPKSKIVK